MIQNEANDCEFEAHKPQISFQLWAHSFALIFTLNFTLCSKSCAMYALFFRFIFSVCIANWHVYNAQATSTWDAICKTFKQQNYHIMHKYVVFVCGCARASRFKSLFNIFNFLLFSHLLAFLFVYRSFPSLVCIFLFLFIEKDTAVIRTERRLKHIKSTI